MTIDFRQDGGGVAVSTDTIPPVTSQSGAHPPEGIDGLAFTPADPADEGLDDLKTPPDAASGLAKHDTAPVTANALHGMADVLLGKAIPTMSQAAQLLKASASGLLRQAATLQAHDPAIWSAFAGLEGTLQRPLGALNLDSQDERIALFAHAQTALVAVRRALAATPPPDRATARTLQTLADGLVTLQRNLSNVQTASGTNNLAGSSLSRDARQAKADLEAMQTLGAADGIPLSQKIAAGDEHARTILQLAGYSVSANGAVTDAGGTVLTGEAVDKVGLSLLHEAAADYQQHKATYKTLRSQLEDQLDMKSRLSLNLLEASMLRLESQQKPTNTKDAIIDALTLMVAKGETPSAISVKWLETAGREGIDESLLTPGLQAFLDRLAGRGATIRRENGRIYIDGLSATDRQDVQGVHQLLTAPDSDAARQLRDAFVQLARSWIRAETLARANGVHLPDVMVSRSVTVETKPPNTRSDDHVLTTNGEVQAREEGGGLSPLPMAGDAETEAVVESPPTPTQQDGISHLAYLSRRLDDLEAEDHDRTDDQRQAALDAQRTRRIAEDTEAAERRAAAKAEDARHT